MSRSDAGSGRTTGFHPVRSIKELARFSARVRDLEAEIRECRQHQQRVAELTDVVQELLLPLSRRDQDKVDEILARYTDQLG